MGEDVDESRARPSAMRCRKGQFRHIGAFGFRYDPAPDEYLQFEENRYYHELMAVLDKVGVATAEVEAVEATSNSDSPEARYVIRIE